MGTDPFRAAAAGLVVAAVSAVTGECLARLPAVPTAATPSVRLRDATP